MPRTAPKNAPKTASSLSALIAATLVTALPAALSAEPVVLRIEAKRGPDTQAVVDGWAAKFPNVVTFPLPSGWTGIGLGPIERAEAEAELDRLKAAGQIPADSFLAPAPENAVPVAGSAPAAAAVEAPAAQDAAAAAAGASTFVPPSGAAPAASEAAADTAQPTDAAATDIAEADAPDTATETDAAPTQTTPPVPEGDFLRLQRFETREAADEALARWRDDFPETGLWQQPDGGFAVALGPMPAATAEAWLGAFRRAERVGRPAAVLPPSDLGTALDAGSAPDLPGPGSAEMPSLIDIQRALRWAGHYEGKIDGKDGPQTQAAIAAEVLTLRAAPDAATAMQALIDRRAAWNAEIGLTRLDDPQSGLSVMAPMDRLQFDRNDQGLSIYGPKDGSGAALILYGAPGGQQEMLDFTGLVTALGWVPSPDRRVDPGHASLKGRNDTHIGQAEARVVDGRVEGLVLIWPVMDEEDQPRVAAEAIDSLTPTARPSPDAEAAATDGAPAEAVPPAN